MLETLFSSDARVRLLKFLFEHEGQALSGGEIYRSASVDAANGSRELKRLVGIGLLSHHKEGPRPVTYTVNLASPLVVGLRQLLFDTGAIRNVTAKSKELSSRYNLSALSDPDEWMLAEEIPDSDLFFFQIPWSAFANEFIAPAGRAFKRVLAIYKGYHMWFYYGEKDSYEEADAIVKKMVRAPSFAARINTEILAHSDRLRAFAGTVPQDDLDELSSRELWNIYTQHDSIHTAYYQWGWLPVAADMFHSNLTTALHTILKDEYGLSDEEMTEQFVILTQPTHPSLILIEQEEFWSIVESIQKDPYHKKLFTSLYRAFEEQDAAPFGLATHTPAYEEGLQKKISEIQFQIKSTILKKIRAHYKKYFYVKFMFIGKEGVHSFEHYLKEVVKWVGRNADASGQRREKRQELARIKAKRAALMKRLKMKASHRTLFDAFGDFMVTKIYRRYAQIDVLYRMKAICEEIARRLDLSLMEVRFMIGQEIKDALLSGILPREEIRKRPDFCAYYVEKGREVVCTGPDASFLESLVMQKEDFGKRPTELKGQTGCMGSAEGVVKIITRPSDMGKMNQGDILVSIATDPDIVPAMKKAGAIVTEQGGVTSHAAIVARELNIPCVIGTKIATRVLKDGDRVSVDANKGIVKLIS